MSSSSSSTNPSNPQANPSQDQPSLLSGHAEYIKGSAEVSPSQSQSHQLSQTFGFPSSSSSSPPSSTVPNNCSAVPIPSSLSMTPATTTPTSQTPPFTNCHRLPSALHQRNRQPRKTKRIRDSRGNHADVMFVAHLSSTQSAIGSITGSHAWTSSGEQDKAHAKASMKAAAEVRDSEGKGYGHVEEVAGKFTGCEGMKEEGKVSAERAKRRD